MPTFNISPAFPVGTFASSQPSLLPSWLYKLDGLNWESLWRNAVTEKKREKEEKRRKVSHDFNLSRWPLDQKVLRDGISSTSRQLAIFFQPWKGNRVYLAPWIIYFSARISRGLISNIMPGCVFGGGGGWFLFAKERGGWIRGIIKR